MGRRRRSVLPEHSAQQERLRTAVRRYVKGHRGQNKKVAELLRRPASFVTEYMDGEYQPNLDESLLLMRYLGWTLDKQLTEVLPPPDAELVAALHDPEVLTLAKALSRAGSQVRDVAIELATMALDRDLTPSGAQSGAPRHAPTPEGSTRAARARRR